VDASHNNIMRLPRLHTRREELLHALQWYLFRFGEDELRGGVI
jgi:hypothetical protein